MNYVFVGYVYDVIKFNEYLLCLKVCLDDGKCVSFNYNFVMFQCEFSNKIKVIELNSFIEKKYFIYIEVL